MGDIDLEWTADAAEILAEISKTVTVRRGAGSPVSFRVIMSAPMIQQDLETGGFLNSTAYDIKFLKTAADASPGVVIFGNLVHFNGADYRIVAINDRPPSAWVIVRVQTSTGHA